MINALDVSTAVLSAGATGLWLATFWILIAGPILSAAAITAATADIYGVGRSINDLVDRGAHGHSISLADREARVLCMSIASGSTGRVFSLASTKLIAKISAYTSAGRIASRTSRIAFTASQIGKLGTGGLRIVLSLKKLLFKLERKELTPVDVFHFVASILFFYNAAIDFQTANRIIKQVQKDILSQHPVRLPPEMRELFDERIGGRGKPSRMIRNARMIGNLKEIKSAERLYEIMVDKQGDNQSYTIYNHWEL